jgi:hypothetical protein
MNWLTALQAIVTSAPTNNTLNPGQFFISRSRV